MTEKRFYIDKDGDLYDRQQPNNILMLDFGYCEAVYVKEVLDCMNSLAEENEKLKQSIKEIDDAELHLKQIILKRIDDYIWEWEDEGVPVAQVLRELRDEIKCDI